MKPLLFSTLPLLAALAGGASAADLPSLPTLAADPQISEPWWHGLTVGSEVSLSMMKGAKALPGGAAFVDYNREFDNRIIVGVQGAAGYAPYTIQNGRFLGANFIGATAFVGYDMGRLTPYLTTTVDFTRASQFDHGFTGGTDAINAFLNGGGETATLGSVGAGFNYAVTNNLSVGMVVGAGTARGVWP